MLTGVDRSSLQDVRGESKYAAIYSSEKPVSPDTMVSGTLPNPTIRLFCPQSDNGPPKMSELSDVFECFDMFGFSLSD